jgi:hypothetical protein
VCVATEEHLNPTKTDRQTTLGKNICLPLTSDKHPSVNRLDHTRFDPAWQAASIHPFYRSKVCMFSKLNRFACAELGLQCEWALEGQLFLQWPIFGYGENIVQPTLTKSAGRRFDNWYERQRKYGVQGNDTRDHKSSVMSPKLNKLQVKMKVKQQLP